MGAKADTRSGVSFRGERVREVAAGKRADTDLLWVRRGYHGLLDAATSPGETEADADLLAARDRGHPAARLG